MKLLKLEKIISKFSKDVGYDKSHMLRLLLGDQNSKKEDELKQTQQSNIPRPQSHNESLSSRKNMETNLSNTGIAAKLAYNNMRKHGEASESSQNNLMPNNN